MPKQLPQGSLRQTSCVKHLVYGFVLCFGFFKLWEIMPAQVGNPTCLRGVGRSRPDRWHRPPLLLEQLESGSGRRSSGSPSRILRLVRCLGGPAGGFDSGSPWNWRAGRRVRGRQEDRGGVGAEKTGAL